MINYKKAAMFGLDARIALAIFGALSTITGATLYKAIQNSKVTAFYTGLTEIEKAIEQYVLDTGSTNINFKLGNLIENFDNIPGWNGPYLNDESSGSVSVYTSSYGMVRGHRRKDGAAVPCGGIYFGITSDTSFRYYISLDEDNTTIAIPGSGSQAFLNKVHDKFDSDGAYDGGKIRVSEGTNGFCLGFRIDALKV